MWARKIEEKAVSGNIVTKLSILPENIETDNRSAYLDVDTDKYIGRIIFWESSFCDLEILNIESGENIYYKHIENCTNNFDLEFEEFFRILKIESVLTD